MDKKEGFVEPNAEQVELSRKRIISTMGLLVFCLAIVAGALYVAYRRTNNHAKTAFRKIEISILPASGPVKLPVISRDGKQTAYIVEENGRQSLWLWKNSVGGANKLIEFTDLGIIGLAFSNDGKSIFYVAKQNEMQDGRLYQVDLSKPSDAVTKELLSGLDSPASFSPNGQYFAYWQNNKPQGETSLIITKIDGSEKRSLITRKQFERPPSMGPVWSTDGRIIACVVVLQSAQGSGMQILAVNPDDGSAQPIGDQNWTSISQLAWLGDGSGLIISGRESGSNLPAFAHPLYLLSLKGELRPVTGDMANYECASVSADSRAIVTVRAEKNSELILINNVEAK